MKKEKLFYFDRLFSTILTGGLIALLTSKIMNGAITLSGIAYLVIIILYMVLGWNLFNAIKDLIKVKFNETLLKDVYKTDNKRFQEYLPKLKIQIVFKLIFIGIALNLYFQSYKKNHVLNLLILFIFLILKDIYNIFKFKQD